MGHGPFNIKGTSSLSSPFSPSRSSPLALNSPISAAPITALTSSPGHGVRVLCVRRFLRKRTTMMPVTPQADRLNVTRMMAHTGRPQLCSVPVVIQQVRLRMKRQEKLFTLSTLQSILASASRLSFHNLPFNLHGLDIFILP